jgi:uncharacterized membrane protein YkvA (DUF1232 family)
MVRSERVRAWVREKKHDGLALWFAYKHPGTPLAAKLLCIFVVAYAFSPIDLIPDFIPVLGYLDDVILLPCLIWVAVRMIPSEVLAECRRMATERLAHEGRPPHNNWGILLVAVLWLLGAWATWRYLVSPYF